LYHYLWDRFASGIIEESKTLLKDETPSKTSREQVLLSILSDSLKLLHPFMPFITEEIWGSLPGNKDNDLLMIETWPE
jgi:valyl-tRNA synthetase